MPVTINDSPWRKLLKRLDDLDRLRVRVGVLASKGGNATEEDGITLVELAAIHEFGSPAAGIPERSFIRSTFQIRRFNAMRTICTTLLKAVTEGKMDVRKALNVLGQWGAAEVKNTITEIDIPPPLAQATIDAKGSSRPLVDTGRMMNAISSEVIDRRDTK